VFFPPSILILGGKVQGFCGKTAKILALEQRIIVLKALACKDNCVVQYTLSTPGGILQAKTLLEKALLSAEELYLSASEESNDHL